MDARQLREQERRSRPRGSGDSGLAKVVHDMGVEQQIQASRINGMRWAIIALACVVSCIIVALLMSPLARADDSKFVNDVEQAGFSGAPTSTYLSAGHAICDSLTQGYTRRSIAETLYEHTKFENIADAMQLVNLAATDICPGVAS